MFHLELDQVAPRSVCTVFEGAPAVLVGSSVAIAAYGLTGTGNDLDIFVSNEFAFGSLTAKAVSYGFVMADDRDAKMVRRWQRNGIGSFHTNTTHLTSPEGVDVNITFKKAHGRALSTVSDVVESFDFGHLAMGFDLELGTFHDYREVLFTDYLRKQGKTFGDLTALPFLPHKEEAWQQGLISHYSAIRQFARYVKHYDYGFHLTEVTETMVKGYNIAADYWGGRDGSDSQKEEYRLKAGIYRLIANKMKAHDIVDMRASVAHIDFTDPLDAVYDSLA